MLVVWTSAPPEYTSVVFAPAGFVTVTVWVFTGGVVGVTVDGTSWPFSGLWWLVTSVEESWVVYRDTSATDPLLSPLHANLHGLPPVQLLAAGNDVLLDDSLAFAARAARSGVLVDLRVWPDATGLDAVAATAMAGFIVANRAASTPSARLMAG